MNNDKQNKINRIVPSILILGILFNLLILVEDGLVDKHQEHIEVNQYNDFYNTYPYSIEATATGSSGYSGVDMISG